MGLYALIAAIVADVTFGPDAVGAEDGSRALGTRSWARYRNYLPGRQAGAEARPEAGFARPDDAPGPLLPGAPHVLGSDRAGASAEDDAEDDDEQAGGNQGKRGDEERPLAHGLFSSAARAFS